MRDRSLHNRRGFAWLLSVAFVLMTTMSGASWQCLDGHPCPPGCTMQRGGGMARPNGAASSPPCCASHGNPQAGKAHCALCATAHAANSRVTTRCTSPVCVLRMQAKPDIHLQSHVHFVPDTTAILLALPACVLIPEETGTVSFSSSRAPPDRAITRLPSPRAPPVFRS